MFAFPGMLVGAAEEAGIPCPPNPDDDYNPMIWKHFHLFCCAQLGNPMPYPGVHFENAKVIADIPAEDIETVTVQDLLDKGFQVGFSK